MKLSRDGFFQLCFERNWDLPPALFLRGRLRGQSVLAVGRHSSMHTCADDSSTAITWAAPRNKMFLLIKKEQKQVSIKRFLKRNLAHVGMVQCMNALADKVHKQEMPCTQWYALHNMATLFNNHPYISSSGTPVGTKFTATYVGMVVE